MLEGNGPVYAILRDGTRDMSAERWSRVGGNRRCCQKAIPGDYRGSNIQVGPFKRLTVKWLQDSRSRAQLKGEDWGTVRSKSAFTTLKLGAGPQAETEYRLADARGRKL